MNNLTHEQIDREVRQMSEYKSPSWRADCPNGCFRKLWEQAVAENRIDGHDPVLEWGAHSYYSVLEIKRWSHRLGRHSRRANGHYLVVHFAYCPHCGERLQEVR